MTIEVSNLTIPVMMRLKMAVNESFCSVEDKSFKLQLKVSWKVEGFGCLKRILTDSQFLIILNSNLTLKPLDDNSSYSSKSKLR